MNPPNGEPGATAFADTVHAVERAKEALVAAVPSPRGKVRRTVAEAVLEFEEKLRQAAGLMDGWRRADVEEEWERCVQGVEESLRRAERLRVEGRPFDYEGLVAALAYLIDPLEVFADVEQRLSSGR